MTVDQNPKQAIVFDVPADSALLLPRCSELGQFSFLGMEGDSGAGVRLGIISCDSDYSGLVHVGLIHFHTTMSLFFVQVQISVSSFHVFCLTG